MKKQTWRDIRVLFSGWELLLHLAFIFCVNYSAFHFISKNKNVSIIVGIIGVFYFFFVFTYQNKKLSNFQHDLNELLKYVTNISFFLQTGENVLSALEGTKTTVTPRIRKDIQKTIDILRDDAVLDTEHFKRYDFPALEQFHKNLSVKYEHGGDAKDLFGQIQHNMVFELKKRDELYRKRKGFSVQVYFMLLMAGVVAVMLRTTVSELWDDFLSFTAGSLAVLLITYGLILLNLYLLQKKNLDISVRM